MSSAEESPPECPECGQSLHYNSLHGYTDCLNPDCSRMYGEVYQMSAIGIAKVLRATLARLPDRNDPSVRLDGVALPRLVAKRIADLLDPTVEGETHV